MLNNILAGVKSSVMILTLLLLPILTGSSLVAGKPIDPKQTSGVTFYGKAADKIIALISDCCNYKGNQKQEERSDLEEQTPRKAKGCRINKPKDCSGLDKKTCPTGIYTIYPGGKSGFDVLCEMKKDGGGWTILQHRQDGSVDFYRNWTAYKRGFGSLKGEFWLGNDHIHQITAQGSYTLRIDLEDFTNSRAYAKYSTFSIDSESNGYKLHIKGYSGTAGNSFHAHNGMKFSTKDKDNDTSGSLNCSKKYKGAWWYIGCHDSNLNGLYLKGKHSSFADGVNWKHWKGYHYSLKTTTMMIKRN